MASSSTFNTETPATPYELAACFNKLPLSAKTPSGTCANSWAVSVRKVDIKPAGLVVLLVNPQSRYMHSEKLPIGPEALGNNERLAAPVALAIMKSFVQGLNPKAAQPPFAPLSFSFVEKDQALAKFVEKQLEVLGVEKQRRKFETLSQTDAKIADQVWKDFYATLQKMVTQSSADQQAMLMSLFQAS